MNFFHYSCGLEQTLHAKGRSLLLLYCRFGLPACQRRARDKCDGKAVQIANEEGSVS